MTKFLPIILTLFCIILIFWTVTTDFIMGLIFLERSLTVVLVVNLHYLLYTNLKKEK